MTENKKKVTGEYPFYQKLNYNCPTSEKSGSGKGSCGGEAKNPSGEMEKTAREMGLTEKQIAIAKEKGITTPLGLRVLEKNTRQTDATTDANTWKDTTVPRATVKAQDDAAKGKEENAALDVVMGHYMDAVKEHSAAEKAAHSYYNDPKNHLDINNYKESKPYMELLKTRDEAASKVKSLVEGMTAKKPHEGRSKSNRN
jgi:hypothetical protein